MSTTIQMPLELKKSLDSLKEHKRESYANVIGRLVSRLKEEEEEKLGLSRDFLKSIKEARKEVRKGKVHKWDEIKKEMKV